MSLRRIVKLSFQPDKCADFETKFQEIKQLIENQNGCEEVKLFRSKKDGNVYFTWSFWESEEALNAYRETPFFDSVWSEVKQWFNARPEAWSTEEIT